MTTVTIDLPDSVLAEFRGSREQAIREVRLAAAVDWFRRGLVFQGRAAELAGLSRPDFMDELANREIPTVHTDLTELKAEAGLE